MKTLRPPQICAGYSVAVSNRGRWGKEDERGTLIFFTPQRVIASTALKYVVTGRQISCGRNFPVHPVLNMDSLRCIIDQRRRRSLRYIRRRG